MYVLEIWQQNLSAIFGQKFQSNHFPLIFFLYKLRIFLQRKFWETPPDSKKYGTIENGLILWHFVCNHSEMGFWRVKWKMWSWIFGELRKELRIFIDTFKSFCMISRFSVMKKKSNLIWVIDSENSGWYIF